MPDPKQPPPFKGFSPVNEDGARPPAAEKSPLERWMFGCSMMFWLLLAVIGLLVGSLFYKGYASSQNQQKWRIALADQRSLAVAIECYFVDNNSYPAWTDDAAFAPQGSNPRAIVLDRQPTFRLRNDSKLMTLTTPIQYLTDYYEDPFSPDSGTPSRYYAVMCDPTITGVTTDTASMWICWSAGPDERFQIDLPLLRRFARAKPHQFTREHLAPFTYDPTNGLESVGDVWRLKM